MLTIGVFAIVAILVIIHWTELVPICIAGLAFVIVIVFWVLLAGGLILFLNTIFKKPSPNINWPVLTMMAATFLIGSVYMIFRERLYIWGYRIPIVCLLFNQKKRGVSDWVIVVGSILFAMCVSIFIAIISH